MSVAENLRAQYSTTVNHSNLNCVTLKVLQNIVVDDRANSLSILFLFKGQAKVNLIATRFCVSLEASKKEVNLSRLF